MTTTTADPEISQATPPAPLTTSPNPPLSASNAALPARLLSPAGDHRQGNLQRLGLGCLGLATLAALPDAARSVASPHGTEAGLVEGGLAFALDLVTLPVAAVLTLTFALPGLLILLGMFDQPLAPARLFQAVARAFYRAGLLGLGATPALVLFALTGASSGLVGVGVALTYLGAGLLSLAALLGELLGSVEKQRGMAPLVVLGWAAFVGLFGLHLFVRLNHEPWL